MNQPSRPRRIGWDRMPRRPRRPVTAMPISGLGAVLYPASVLRTMRHMHGQWATLGAAWLLVVQLLIGGFMQGAAAAPASSAGDVLGIICSSDDAPLSPTGPAEHSRASTCCTLGCPALATLGWPAEGTIRLAPARVADIAVTYDTGRYSPAAVDRSSARARAPPLPTV
jgi:hypothetical protein